MSCCGGSGQKPEESKSCDTTKSGCGCGCGTECKCGPGCACKASGCGPSACAPKKCCPVKCVLTVILGGFLASMVMYLFEGFWHGTYLAPVYDQTKTLWRTLPDMQSLGAFYAWVTIAIGMVLSFIFAQNYRGKGVPEGIRYGFYVGVLLGLSHFALYLALPISLNLATLWLFGWIIEGVLVGITLSLTYMAAAGSKGSCKPKGMCGTPAQGSCGK